MNFNEAKQVVVDSTKSFQEKYQAAAVLIGSDIVKPNDLLSCLEIPGVIGEMAAMKLHIMTGRPRDNVGQGVRTDRAEWEQFLKQSK